MKVDSLGATLMICLVERKKNKKENKILKFELKK